jgi:hypothetical protein
VDKQSDDNDDYFEANMKTVLPDVVEGEHKEYSEGGRMVRPPANLYQWWNAQDHISSMRQLPFDHISIPAMNVETEGVFSDTNLFISDLRSRLGGETLKRLECIRKWILGGDDESKNRRHISQLTRLYGQSSL